MPTRVSVEMVPKSWRAAVVPLPARVGPLLFREDEPLDMTRLNLATITIPLVLWTGETSGVEGYVGWTLIAGQNGMDHKLRGFVREDDPVLSGLLKSDLVAHLDLLAVGLDCCDRSGHTESAIAEVREFEAAERRAGQERMDRLGLNMLQHVP